MEDIEKLAQLTKKVGTLERDAMRSEADVAAAKDYLSKNFGMETVEEADAAAETKEKDLAALRKTFAEGVTEVENTYKDLLALAG